MKYKNRNSVYELVDAVNEIVFREIKCQLCGFNLSRSSNKVVATYSQVGGILLQKKSFHSYCTPPNIYVAGKGFKKD